jgi:ACS family glucarate transporter-like MFS transporter
MGFATLLFATSSSLMVGIAAQFAIGLSAGPIFSAGVKLISSWFGQIGRATAMGFFMTATSLAIVMANTVVPRLAIAGSWRTAFYYLGAVTIVSGLAAILIVRDHVSDRRNFTQPLQVAAQLLRNRNFRWLAVANLGGPWGGFGFAIWTPTLLVDKFHISLVQAGFIVATYGAGAVGAKLFIGLLSDVTGGHRKLLTMIFLSFCGVGLLVFGNSNDLLAFRIAAPILGIAALSYSPLLNTMIAESAKGTAGSAAGFALALTILGESIQPSLIAITYHITQSFPLIFGIFAAGPLVAVFALTRVDSTIK